MTWQTIDTAPTDGTLVKLKRVVDGRPLFEGGGFYGLLNSDAPSRQPLEPDPLRRPPLMSPDEERSTRENFMGMKHWLREGGMFLFPTPTHWAPTNGELSPQKQEE